MLLYGTAGVAFAKYDGFNGTVIVTGGDEGNDGQTQVALGPLTGGGPGGAGGVAVVTKNRGDDVETGFVIGTGADVKLSDRVSLGMEGLYYFFDDAANGAIINPSTEKPFGGIDDDNEFLVVRARLTFHFQSQQPTTPFK